MNNPVGEPGAQKYLLFQRPVDMLFTMDRSLSLAQSVDVGILMQSVMLLAREHGLATCPQASWAMWPYSVREVLGLDNKEIILAGTA
jgi:nitroreductase